MRKTSRDFPGPAEHQDTGALFWQLVSSIRWGQSISLPLPHGRGSEPMGGSGTRAVALLVFLAAAAGAGIVAADFRRRRSTTVWLAVARAVGARQTAGPSAPSRAASGCCASCPARRFGPRCRCCSSSALRLPCASALRLLVLFFFVLLVVVRERQGGRGFCSKRRKYR